MINRWVLKHEGRPELLGICTNIIGLLGGLLLFFLYGDHSFSIRALFFGTIYGICYSLGFIMIIFNCLKIGPTGPTSTVTNIGALVGPTIASFLWFSNKNSPSFNAILGLICCILSIILISLKKDDGKQKSDLNRKWIRLIILGGIFSMISAASQYLAIQYDTNSTFSFIIVNNGVSLIILLFISFIKQNKFPRKGEILAGTYTGIANVTLTVLLFALLKHISAIIVYPLTIAIPMLLILIVGSYFYKEKLTKVVILGCISGLIGVGFLFF